MYPAFVLFVTIIQKLELMLESYLLKKKTATLILLFFSRAWRKVTSVAETTQWTVLNSQPSDPDPSCHLLRRRDLSYLQPRGLSRRWPDNQYRSHQILNSLQPQSSNLVSFWLGIYLTKGKVTFCIHMVFASVYCLSLFHFRLEPLWVLILGVFLQYYLS